MKWAFTVLLFTVAAVGTANTFTGNGGAGQSTVGPGGDYASLAAAATDFSYSATPVTGDYTLLITGDLSEPNNIAFGKNTAGHTVTIRPAASTHPVVTFTSSTKNVGWDAHLAIGTTSTQIAGDQLTTTSNFVIDGSNSIGGTTRDLTFTNTVPANTNPGIPMIVLRVVGACDGCQFKNLVIDNESTATGQNVIGVEFTSRHASSPYSEDYIPTNGLVQNCAISCMKSSSGSCFAIECRNSNTIASGKAQTGMRFLQNDVSSMYSCLDMSQNADAQITSNTFVTIAPLSGGTRCETVRHNSCNGTSGWTMNIVGNKWLHSQGVRGTAGINNVLNVGGGVTGPGATVNVYNNFFGGYDLTGCAVSGSPVHGPADGLYHCLVVGGTTCTANINFSHNSINMPNWSAMTRSACWERYGAVTISTGDYRGTFRMFNNIIRMEQNNGVVLYEAPQSTALGSIVSDYNTYWLGSAGAQFACINRPNWPTVVNYPNLADFQATGQDAHSNVVNPLSSFGGAGKWVDGPDDNDLHFDAAPSAAYSGTPLPAVTTDIDGQPRSSTAPYRGADERAEAFVPISTAAHDWQLFR